MRILHTSDWHLGRCLHGADLLGAQRTALAHLAATTREEAVDVVVVAGDLYDRALPPAGATQLLDDALWELAGAARLGVVVITGNHDSPARLTYGGRFLERSGVHLRTEALRVGEPAVAVEGLVVYALPYLDPAVTAVDLAPGAPGHAGVLTAAMERVRADLSTRAGAASVVVSHSWVRGASGSDSERDISVGGVGQVSPGLFSGVDYVALGHLHRPQAVTDTVRYSGSLLPFSFSEAGRDKVALLVDLVAGGGVSDVREVVLPRERDLVTVRGELAELLSDRRWADAESMFVSAVLTDQVRPAQAMARLQQRFPHALQVSFAPVGVEADDASSYGQRVAGRSEREVIELFVERVRGSRASASERALLDLAREAVGIG